MILNKVTITGADDTTDVQQLVDLSKEFPFVEWGILFSKSQEGGPRFPTRKWMDQLLETPGSRKLQLSAHLCGAWVRQLLEGSIVWDELPEFIRYVNRVQINTHGIPHTYNKWEFLSCCNKLTNKPQFIFQLDETCGEQIINELQPHELNAAGLFDTSSGAGVVPDAWLSPFSAFPCGYAGGLGPDNVIQQLHKICEFDERALGNLYKDYRFWIDMETRVRTEDDSRLHMAKVRSVLEQCAPLINNQV